MSLYLILTGSTLQGILLLVLGASVIGLMDNFIRPLMIEGKAKGMHVLLVFFALLGGLFFRTFPANSRPTGGRAPGHPSGDLPDRVQRGVGLMGRSGSCSATRTLQCR